MAKLFHGDNAEFWEDIFYSRVKAARVAIIQGGGPSALSRALSTYSGQDITVDRISKWRYTGIPVEWGVVVEHVTGFPRERLNPWEYTPDAELSHSLYTEESNGESDADG